jgi:short-subunit dehydrogenase
MMFGIDVVIVAPGPVKTSIWSKGREGADIARYQNSPYMPALQKVTSFIGQLESIGLPPEKIAEVVHDALTLPNPKVRYHVAPDTVRHVLAAVLPKRVMDRMIAKRLGLMPPAT